jgi:hypothetical protein
MTMATVAALISIIVPPGGAPAVTVMPQLPFGRADPGTITGWLLDEPSTKMLTDIAR